MEPEKAFDYAAQKSKISNFESNQDGSTMRITASRIGFYRFFEAKQEF